MSFELEKGKLQPQYTIPMILHCPQCGERHIDEHEFSDVAHHTHACQSCGFVWRPAKVNTHGVRFLPGYSNAETFETSSLPHETPQPDGLEENINRWIEDIAPAHMAGPNHTESRRSAMKRLAERILAFGKNDPA